MSSHPATGHGDALHAAFLYGINIPGGRCLTGQQVESALQALQPSVTFASIVGRPDSVLLWSDGTTTEDAVRRSVSAALNCPCVVVATATLTRVVDAALASLRALGYATTAPYRVTAEGVEWELCLVLSSDVLPADADGDAWLFGPTPRAIAIKVLERHALLARKRRLTARGKRVTLGAVLIDPWVPVLAQKGVTVACLTSRTLNRAAQVVAAAGALRG